jgi:myo-inositol-1-phosphate synthase
MKKLGVVIVGVGGAVASTVIAGVELMLRGLVPRIGMLTEESDISRTNPLHGLLDFAPLEDLVFAGWDIQQGNVYEASLKHKVLPTEQLGAVRDALEAIVPWPATFSKRYATTIQGENVLAEGNSYRDHIRLITKNIEDFKAKHGLERVVMLNLASTESYLEVGAVHTSLAAFEAGLDESDPAISPAMRYFYAANKLGIPYCNFTPSLTNVPALNEQAEAAGNPFTGADGKTGQTLVKTALASMFRVRQLRIAGWYSVNFLGNNDGLALDSPTSNKTKVLSKASVLDSIVGYRVENHQVHIHYYKPRGDAKEAWDNIDIVGFAGVPMQMKINFLCQDSVLAAPLVLDLIRLLDVAKTAGERGIQRQLSLFFKSPYASPGETPTHDLFDQEEMLIEWAKKHATHPGAARAAERNGAGGHHAPEHAAPAAGRAGAPIVDPR